MNGKSGENPDFIGFKGSTLERDDVAGVLQLFKFFPDVDVVGGPFSHPVLEEFFFDPIDCLRDRRDGRASDCSAALFEICDDLIERPVVECGREGDE